MGTRTRNFANNIAASGNLVSLDATKLTGTIADARISSSSVVQHSPETDLQPVKADITALALREATNESSAAYNLPNQFIDTFSDDTNLGTQTDCDRVSGYMSTVYDAVGEFTNDANTIFLHHFNHSSGHAIDSGSNGIDLSNYSSNVAWNSSEKKFGTHSAYFDGGANTIMYSEDLDANDNSVTTATTGAFTLEMWYKYTARSGTDRIAQLDNRNDNNAPFTGGGTPFLSFGYNNNYMNLYGRHGADHNWDVPGTATGSNYTTSAWQHLAIERDTDGTTLRFYLDGTLKGTESGWSQPANDAFGRFVLGCRTGSTSEMYQGYIDELRYSNIERYAGTNFTPNTISATNATGTLIQSANAVGSAKTKVGGTMLYKDNSGTATLGTDLKIYFTCNGGTNWTEAASYNAVTPVYSTGVKQVRLGETTCTSGTDVRYKAVWANQASGSKETQLHGMGINY